MVLKYVMSSLTWVCSNHFKGKTHIMEMELTDKNQNVKLEQGINQIGNFRSSHSIE